MGASEFFNSGTGSSVREVFNNLVSEARYENGHGGYTGTIAEKHDYKSASSEVFESYDAAYDFASEKMSDDNHWCQDKWGPAAYLSFKNKKGELSYLFFGWASS